MLKEKGYWQNIQSQNRPSKIRMKATNIIVSVLGEIPLRVRMNKEEDFLGRLLFSMTNLSLHASFFVFGVLYTLFGKRHKGKET